jgi:DNA-binding response OmpR family regulator
MPAKPTILVVDDDAPILALMRNLLREFGFDAVTAASGQEALSAAREQTPALVLVDKNMPGMTGEEVIAALRALEGFDKVPILILSGAPVNSDELVALRADGAVMKPFDVIALVDQIRSFTDSRAAAD